MTKEFWETKEFWLGVFLWPGLMLTAAGLQYLGNLPNLVWTIAFWAGVAGLGVWYIRAKV